MLRSRGAAAEKRIAAEQARLARERRERERRDEEERERQRRRAEESLKAQGQEKR